MHPAKTFLAILFIISTVAVSHAKEIESHYAIIIYGHVQELRKFNNGLVLEKRLYAQFKKRQGLTFADDVKNKVDVIVEKAESILDMPVEKKKFKIHIVFSAGEVHRIYFKKFKTKAEYKAFYSPGDDTVFISAPDTSLRVLSHEIGHVLVEHYFKVPPPVKIHELLAQFVEQHMTD